jgi:hypothetical protein
LAAFPRDIAFVTIADAAFPFRKLPLTVVDENNEFVKNG